MKLGTVGPHCEEPRDDIQRGFRSRASNAASDAMIKAGNEPEAPIATASPFWMSHSLSRRTISPAKLGFVLVLLDPKLPIEVVISECSIPMSPVSLISVLLSMLRPLSKWHAFRASVASSMISDARIISFLKASDPV